MVKAEDIKFRRYFGDTAECCGQSGSSCDECSASCRGDHMQGQEMEEWEEEHRKECQEAIDTDPTLC